jgi:hypothetical protein
MSDLIRHARAGLGGLRAGGGVTSSTPGSDLLSLDIDFASCRAGSCAALSRDPRGHLYFFCLFFSFLISSATKTQPQFAQRHGAGGGAANECHQKKTIRRVTVC